LKNRSTTFLRIHSNTLDLSYDQQGYLNYAEPVPLLVRGEEEQKSNLYFPVYENSMTYIDLMILELKAVFEQFNLPQHRWYQAQAGYDLEFVSRMKKYFKIDYDIDLDEKRDYWILQLLFIDSIKELDYPSISFDLVNFDTQEKVDFIHNGTIKSYDEYVAYTEGEYEKRKCVLDIKDFIYRKNYDILWGGTQIVFNEKVKLALEATGIITAENGLEFAEFTDYQIQMLGDQA